MNRARKLSASGIVLALLCLAGTGTPQKAGSGGAEGKTITAAGTKKDQSGKTAKNGKGADAGTKSSAATSTGAPLVPHDPAVTQQQLKSALATIQVQHTNDLNSLKRDLDSFKEKLTKEKPAPSQQELDSLHQQIEATKQDMEETKKLALLGFALGLFALILVILIIIFKINPLIVRGQQMLQQSNELKESCNILREDVQQLKRGGKNFITVDSFEPYRKTIEQLQTEVSKLTKRGSGRTDIDDQPLEQSWGTAQEPRNQPQMAQTQSAGAGVAFAQARTQVLYANIPDRDGYFRDANLRYKSEWDSLYKLILDDSDTATVEIFNDSDRFEAAMKAAHDYLSPVCNYGSNPPASAKKIRQVSAGKARREGEAWKVVDKLAIEFV